MKQILRFSLVIFAVLILIGGLYYFFTKVNKWYSLLPFKGELSSEVSNFEGQVGDFRIEWKNQQLSIFNKHSKSNPIFETESSEAFLTAATGIAEIEEAKGSFLIEDQLESSFPFQVVKQITQLTEVVEIHGVLKDVVDSASPIPFLIEIRSDSTDQLSLNATVLSSLVNRVFLNYESSKEEAFWGFGEQFSHFNLKGHRVPIFISEQGIGRGDEPTTFLVDAVAKSGGNNYTSYACVPHYISNENYSLNLQNSEYSVFDLREDQVVRLQVWSDEINMRILDGNSPLDLIEKYTAYSGRMKALPDWMSNGAIIGMQGGTEKVRDVWAKLKEQEVPLAGFWLQDWVGQRTTSFGKQLWWNWELDRDHYSGWEKLMADFDAADLQVMLYINCFLADVSEKENARKNYFLEADEKGFLLKSEKGESLLIENTSFSAGMLDLSNPKAVAWIQEIIQREMLDIGADGWMADFGEALPIEAHLHDGSSALEAHNAYPTAWAETNRTAVADWNDKNTANDTTDSVDPKSVPFFCRAGYSKSPGQASLFWLGDQNVNWGRNDGIKSAVTGMLSGGMSGFSINHSDIGGYTTLDNFPLVIKREEELLLRWMELNALSPVFRSHEGNRPGINAQVYSNERIMQHFARMATLFKELAPYRKRLMREAEGKGWPMVRHMLLHYPNEPKFAALTYEQFMLGDQLIMAPVCDPNVNSSSIILPAGEWVHLWSHKRYEVSGTESIQVDAPIGEPAIFARPKLLASLLNSNPSLFKKNTKADPKIP